jgi:N-acetylneuraminic acid mutarotase
MLGKKYFKNISKIFQKYFKNISKIFQKYFKNISKIFQKYFNIFQNISKESGYFFSVPYCVLLWKIYI